MKACSPGCQPVCDFCVWFNFNGDKDGVYLNLGECVHPEHPHDEDPGNSCDDFECVQRADTNPVALARHSRAHRENLRDLQT